MRRVLVTGGTRGIGAAIADAFADEDVAAIGRADCDVTDPAAVDALFERVGALDVLVINAGAASSAPLAKTTVADWANLHAINATGAFLCTRAALPRLNEHGRIVTVASVSGRVGSKYTAAYTASKHAAVGLMRTAAAELAGTTKTANAVCPGYVRTEMTERTIANIEARTGRDGEAELAKLSPLGRLIEPEEVAFAVAFLAAPQAGAINGQTLILDGGGIQT
jgi:NAD(P)-dependent dehydrogenase (short-subunit alcohol dehydrogenase family)